MADPSTYASKTGGSVMASEDWETIATLGNEVTRKLCAAARRLKKK